VLDPACGSVNFLYVALEPMKRLEGEVNALLSKLGEDQSALGLEGNTVDPHQFLGIELNPWAAAMPARPQSCPCWKALSHVGRPRQPMGGAIRYEGAIGDPRIIPEKRRWPIATKA
jgi:hypothetical protein